MFKVILNLALIKSKNILEVVFSILFSKERYHGIRAGWAIALSNFGSSINERRAFLILYVTKSILIG